MSSDKQIFHDPSMKRWKYSRLLIIVFSILAIVALCFSVASFFVETPLPKLRIASVEQPLRSATSVTENNANEALADKDKDVAVKKGTLPSSDVFTATSVKNPNKPKAIGFYVNWDDNSFSSLKANIASVDELMPEWLHLSGSDGAIEMDDADKQNKALDLIHQEKPDLLVAPLINNINSKTSDWDVEMLATMLKSPQSRTRNIQAILDFVQQNHFGGVSIDYESVPNTSQKDLVLFMKELYATFHPLGLQVTQNIPLEDESFDVKTLAQYNDYLIFMAYDEHSLGDTPAGAIASQSWFTQNVKQRLVEAGNAKSIVALGAYGYDWKEGGTTGDELTFQDAMRIARQSNDKITIDPVTLNPTFDYYDASNTLHHVWFLDATSLFNEVKATQGGVYGYALWRMGSEDPSIWKVFTPDNVSTDASVAHDLQTVEYGYDIDYTGTGEVIRVSQAPQLGNRDIGLDATGFINSESVNTYPSAYTVDEWGGEVDKKVALTFDDGPDASYTPQILDILKAHNVAATFFIIGSNATQNQGILKRMYAEGSEIGNHTMTHPNIATISDSVFRVELNSTERLIESLLNHRTLLFRPPYAEDIEPETPDQVKPLELTNEFGYYTVTMHVDPNDWAMPGVDQIVENTVTGIESGDGKVVLLHDSGGDRSQTIAALPKIIERLQADGYQLTTISGLMNVSRDEVMPPVSASETIYDKANSITFTLISYFFTFLTFIFQVGIVLGIARILFILVLGSIQFFQTRYRQHVKKYAGSVSVIVPAHNEEAVIARTISSILQSTYPVKEVVVIDDGSTDETFAVVQREFAGDDRVKAYSIPNGGKAQAMNFGLKSTQAEVVITLDADTLFQPDAIGYLVQHFSDVSVGAVAGNAKVGNRLNILTKWQALEYITSQNLDRRAFEYMNCISVVPGSIGAWRRQAILDEGGFSEKTLAEDADMTLTFLRRGYKVLYEDNARAYTEAPDTVRGFMQQRFRWMFGTLQAAWLHKDTFLKPKYKALGSFVLPNIVLFQIFFPLISPIMDITVIASSLWTWYQRCHHPEGMSAYNLGHLLVFYIVFQLIDFIAASIALLMEKKEDWKLLWWLLPQRFFYRQLLYIIAIRVVLAAIKGKIIMWGSIERKNTAHL